MSSPAANKFGTVKAKVRLGDATIQFSATVPAGPTRLDELLPVLQALCDQLVGQAERDAADRQACVSCKKGCGACCRQLVPLSPVDARHVAQLVEKMPEPQRSEVTARFAEAKRRLEQAGLWEKLKQRQSWSEGAVTEVGLEYFRLGIACPFLVDEACSIHQDRPLSCREYLVTSPAENCAQPTAQSIRCLPLAASVWVAAARCETTAPEAVRLNWVPLIEALEWASEHEAPPAEKSGQEVLRQVIECLGRTGSSPRPTAFSATSSLPSLAGPAERA